MDFIDKQNGPLSIHSLQIFGLPDNLLHILLPGYGCIDLGKFRLRGIRNDLRKGGFPGSGRSVKNEGAQLVCLNCPVQKLVLSDNMLLPYHLIQCGRPQSRRQRGFFFFIGIPHIFKQIHGLILLGTIDFFLLRLDWFCKARGMTQVDCPVATAYNSRSTNDVTKGNRK